MVMRWLAFGLVSVAMMGRCASSPPPAPPQPPAPGREAPLIKALSDQSIFGPDFAAVIRVLPAFSAAGENRVMLFTDRVVGTKRYATLEEGQRAAKSILERGERNMSPTLPLPPPRGRITTITAIRSLDDRAIHVVAVLDGARFLAPALRLDVIEQRLGPPEKHEQLVIDDGTDRHPLVLELYSYDAGAIVFATREGTLDPRAIDRVFLDAQRITAAVF